MISPDADDPPRGTLGGFLMRGGALAAGGRGAVIVIALGVNGLVTRLLSPPDAGTYFLLLSIVSVFSTVGQLGLGRAALRLLGYARVQAADRVAPLVGGLSTLALAGGGGMALLLLAGSGQALLLLLGVGDPGAVVLVASAVWIMAKASSDVTSECFRGLRRIGHAIVAGPLLQSSLLLASLAALWAWTGYVEGAGSVRVVVAATGASALAAAAFSQRLLTRLYGSSSARPTGWRELLEESWPYLGSGLIAILWDAVGYWLIGTLGDRGADVALYGAALRASQLVVAPLLITHSVLPPVITELAASSDQRRLSAVVRTASSLAIWPGLAVLGVFLLSGESLLRVVFGDFYGQGLPTLLLLGLAQGISVATGPTGLVLLLTGHRKVHLSVNACSLATQVAFGAVLVVRFGAPGMAGAVLAARCLQQLSFLLLVRRRIGIWAHATLSPRHVARLLADLDGGRRTGDRSR